MPAHQYYFEDMSVGTTYDLGDTAPLTEQQIIAFAREFDPQPFHIDPEAAQQSYFGGIIASGWHTCGLAMRLLVDGLLSKSASLGSPGIEQIRWTKPVRPGDTLHATILVQESRPSTSKPDRGTIRWHMDVTNQHGELVMWMESYGLVGRRPVAS